MIKKSKKHLSDAQESYFQHMAAALSISSQLFIASFKALIDSLDFKLFKDKAPASK